MKLRKLLQIIFMILVVNAVFSTILMYLEERHFKGINRNQSAIRQWLECYYFGLTTITTVGYGDIVPASFEARMLVMAYLIVVISISIMMP